MANPEHLEILQQGVAAWNVWRKECQDVIPDLSYADLRGSHFEFRRGNLSGANLYRANLRFADLSGADVSNAGLMRAALRHTKLAGGLLLRADLREADLQGAYLNDSDFDDAVLQGASLQGADLRRTSFKGARLLGANFEASNLWGSDLRYADLRSANFRSAILDEANFLGSVLGQTIIAGIDLSGVHNLNRVQHRGPSVLDAGTLRRSSGRIDASFLRGCGYLDWEIGAAKLHDPDLNEDERISITYEIVHLRGEQPMAMHRLFLSYSSADSAFVEAIEKRLDEEGIRYWRDAHDLTAGPVERQIDRALTLYPTVLLVLSERSVESDWVEWEAEKARTLEKKLRKQGVKRHVLCPVALDETWKDCDWEDRLRRQITKYHVLDFSHWRDEEKFQSQMVKLFKGLSRYYRP